MMNVLDHRGGSLWKGGALGECHLRKCGGEGGAAGEWDSRLQLLSGADGAWLFSEVPTEQMRADSHGLQQRKSESDLKNEYIMMLIVCHWKLLPWQVPRKAPTIIYII